MRIRKRGNAQTGESLGAQHPGGGVGGSHQEQEQEQQLAVSSLPVEETNASADEGEHDMRRDTTGEDDPLRRTLGVSVNAPVNAGTHDSRAGRVGGMTSHHPPPTLVVDLWQQSGRAASSNPSETYMNLDEFVDSLARENCFPADDSTSHPRGSNLMSMLNNSDLHFERLARGSSNAPPSRLSTYAELDTSLRLGQASHSHPIMAPTQERGKSKMDFQTKFESSSESDGSQNLSPEFRLKSRENPRPGCNAGTSGDAGTSKDPELESRNEKNVSRPSHLEMFDESDMAQRPVSDIEAVRREMASSPSDQLTRKSSTESMEPAGFSRKRRVSEEPASSKRRRISSPAPITTEELLAADHPAKQSKGSLMFSLYTVYHDAGREGLTAGEAISTVMQQALPGFEESECRSRRHVTKLLRNSPYFMELGEGKFALCSAMIDAEEDDPDPDPDASEEAGGSDSSNRSGGASTLPVSSSSLAMTDSEKRKQEVELERKVSDSGGGGGGTTAAAGAASSQQTERKPSGRSGRPKRLKYLKQDNVEELGNQCNRSDGKGWTCPLLAKTGYQLCDHHLDKLRCKPGSRSKYNKKKKKKHN